MYHISCKNGFLFLFIWTYVCIHTWLEKIPGTVLIWKFLTFSMYWAKFGYFWTWIIIRCDVDCKNKNSSITRFRRTKKLDHKVWKFSKFWDGQLNTYLISKRLYNRNILAIYSNCGRWHDTHPEIYLISYNYTKLLCISLCLCSPLFYYLSRNLDQWWTWVLKPECFLSHHASCICTCPF